MQSEQSVRFYEENYSWKVSWKRFGKETYSTSQIVKEIFCIWNGLLIWGCRYEMDDWFVGVDRRLKPLF